MRLFEYADAAYCQRVSIYLTEKELRIPRVQVDIFSLEHKKPEFLAINPAGRLPVLETNDSQYIAESAAIVEYLEELFPNPPMLGASHIARAKARRAERIASDIFTWVTLHITHVHLFFKTRPGRPVDQSVAVADEAYRHLLPLLEVVEHDLAERDYLCGASPTVGDCTLLAGLRMAMRFGFELPANAAELRRWFDLFDARVRVKTEMAAR